MRKEEKITIADFIDSGLPLRCVKNFDSNIGAYVSITSSIDDIDQNVPLFKYTQLPFLTTIFEQNQFYVNNRSQFSDRREFGEKTLAEIVHTFRTCSGKIAKQQNRRLDETNNSLCKQHISCWTKGSPNVSEDALMWMSYASKYGQFACRIKTSVARFVDNILDLPVNLIIAPISYSGVNDSRIESFKTRFFQKVDYYRNEREVRFLWLTNSSEPHLYQCINPSFIEEIMLSPFSDRQTISFIKSNLENQYPFLKGKITTPQVMEF